MTMSFHYDPIEMYHMCRRTPIAYIGSACANKFGPKSRAGFGIHWEYRLYPNVSETITGTQTSERAEITAARRAIETAQNNGRNEIYLRTDSFFILSAEQWITHWDKYGYIDNNGDDIPYKRDFLALRNSALGIDVRFEDIDQTVRSYGHECAVKLAKDAVGMPYGKINHYALYHILYPQFIVNPPNKIYRC